MVYSGLNDLVDKYGVDRNVVMKFDDWLSRLPQDFSGYISPTAFAENADVDTGMAAALFNSACAQNILELEFAIVCPTCGQRLGCLEDNSDSVCQCNKHEELHRGAKNLRIAYKLRQKSGMLN